MSAKDADHEAAEPQPGTFREEAVDARRYRWLREQHKIGVQREPGSYFRWGAGDDLDAIADAGIRAAALAREQAKEEAK